jgi:hypothetical protein
MGAGFASEEQTTGKGEKRRRRRRIEPYVVPLPGLVEPPGLGLQLLLLRWFIFGLWLHDNALCSLLLREVRILSRVMTW